MLTFKTLAVSAASIPATAFADIYCAAMCPFLQTKADGNGGRIPVPLANVAEMYEASGFGSDSGMYKALSGQNALTAVMKAGIEYVLADTCDGNLTSG